MATSFVSYKNYQPQYADFIQAYEKLQNLQNPDSLAVSLRIHQITNLNWIVPKKIQEVQKLAHFIEAVLNLKIQEDFYCSKKVTQLPHTLIFEKCGAVTIRCTQKTVGVETTHKKAMQIPRLSFDVYKQGEVACLQVNKYKNKNGKYFIPKRVLREADTHRTLIQEGLKHIWPLHSALIYYQPVLQKNKVLSETTPFRTKIAKITPWADQGNLLNYAKKYNMISVCKQVVSAVKELHATDRIHGDLNVLNFLVSNNRVYLNDFDFTFNPNINIPFPTKNGYYAQSYATAPEQLEKKDLSLLEYKACEVSSMGRTILWDLLNLPSYSWEAELQGHARVLTDTKKLKELIPTMKSQIALEIEQARACSMNNQLKLIALEMRDPDVIKRLTLAQVEDKLNVLALGESTAHLRLDNSTYYQQDTSGCLIL